MRGPSGFRRSRSERYHIDYSALESMYCQRFVLTYLQLDSARASGQLATPDYRPDIAPGARRGALLDTPGLPPRGGELTGDVLGPTKTEGPVPRRVFDVADEHVLAGNPGGGETLGDRGEQGLFGLLVAPGPLLP
jgi:hypothetical protein